MTVLITGTSGFIGQELARRLHEERDIVCLSRGAAPTAKAPFVRGSFDRFEDLRGLDQYDITAVVHLAAVTGGCSEEDGLAVNVLGTRRLYRYLLDRGCRKFITASSIAVVGGLSRHFVPNVLPIPDEHPCLAVDAYGFSKAAVEDLTRYFYRSHEDADFVNLRFGAVVDDSWTLPAAEAPMSIPFVQLAHVYVSDILDALQCVLASPPKAGVRTCNVVGPEASCRASTLDALHGALGDRSEAYDLSYYDNPEHGRKPIYSMERMKREFGFEPSRRFG
ncbi:NAD-dependent epimerase/dehydratase family protein [Cohnella fermenti]|uniref:NAD(P)-dependent oxidoreductase n=1 Tax=Cohnella fermenti TaxID=2565925 RepID=A0A4S4BSA3_9BACL|nr:NAD(P)-dependent oxidoreductase [Cohnella fermenti]THF77096.1 NAD(P)-dependent oxidoreductase [Cohnella fermenti]